MAGTHLASYTPEGLGSQGADAIEHARILHEGGESHNRRCGVALTHALHALVLRHHVSVQLDLIDPHLLRLAELHLSAKATSEKNE